MGSFASMSDCRPTSFLRLVTSTDRPDTEPVSPQQQVASDGTEGQTNDSELGAANGWFLAFGSRCPHFPPVVSVFNSGSLRSRELLEV
jgi:hypothetical protein